MPLHEQKSLLYVIEHSPEAAYGSQSPCRDIPLLLAASNGHSPKLGMYHTGLHQWTGIVYPVFVTFNLPLGQLLGISDMGSYSVGRCVANWKRLVLRALGCFMGSSIKRRTLQPANNSTQP